MVLLIGCMMFTSKSTVQVLGRRRLSSVHLDGFGNPLSVLRFDAKPAAVTQAGDVHVAVSHAAVTAEDVAQIRGESLLRRSVGLAGSSAVGRIVQAAPGARSASGAALQQGQHVLVLQDGTWADQVGASAQNVFVLPAGAESNAQTALLPLYVSAWALLRHVLDLKAGEKVLQTAGWTHLGHAISQVGRAVSVEVVSPTLEEFGSKTFVANIKDKHKNVVVLKGGLEANAAIGALSSGGRLAILTGSYRSFLQQEQIGVPYSSAIFRGASIVGFNLLSWAQEHPLLAQQAVSEVAALCKTGDIVPVTKYQTAIAGAHDDKKSIVLSW